MDRRLFVFMLGMFAIGTDSFVMAGILSDISASFGVNMVSAGSVVTAYALSFALLSPVVAAVFSNWPRKRLLIIGLAVFVASNLVTATAPTFTILLLTRVMAGLGAAMFSPTVIATAAGLVPAEKRGLAIAIVMAGLSGATALGAPIGTALGSIYGWRTTMWFVSVLGIFAALGISLMLTAIPLPAPITLRQRLAPLADTRVALTLLATLTIFAGLYVTYTYISVAFERATGADGKVLSGLLFIWGIAATAGNLGAGHLVDRFGSRRVLVVAAAIAAIDFALMPWSTAHMATTALATIVWGICGWAMVIPQQHRLISISSATAPLLLALNSTALYVGVALSGLLGGIGLRILGRYQLGFMSALLILLGLLLAELADFTMRRRTAIQTC